jgi:hypothetical protein
LLRTLKRSSQLEIKFTLNVLPFIEIFVVSFFQMKIDLVYLELENVVSKTFACKAVEKDMFGSLCSTVLV